MKDGESGEFMLAYHAYHEHGILPSVFSELSFREKAIINAFIQEKIKQDERNNRRAEAKARRGRRS